MANDVVDADAAGAVEVDEGGCCEDVEVRLVPADEVPFDEEAAAGGPPYWVAYFTVESTDAAIETASGLGGGALMPAMDVGMGRISALRDPQGAVFCVFEGEVDD